MILIYNFSFLCMLLQNISGKYHSDSETEYDLDYQLDDSVENKKLRRKYKNQHYNILNYYNSIEKKYFCSCSDCVVPIPSCESLCVQCSSTQSQIIVLPYPVPILLSQSPYYSTTNVLVDKTNKIDTETFSVTSTETSPQTTTQKTTKTSKQTTENLNTGTTIPSTGITITSTEKNIIITDKTTATRTSKITTNELITLPPRMKYKQLLGINKCSKYAYCFNPRYLERFTDNRRHNIVRSKGFPLEMIRPTKKPENRANRNKIKSVGDLLIKKYGIIPVPNNLVMKLLEKVNEKRTEKTAGQDYIQ